MSGSKMSNNHISTYLIYVNGFLPSHLSRKRSTLSTLTVIYRLYSGILAYSCDILTALALTVWSLTQHQDM